MNDIVTPFLFIDEEILDRNIRSAADFCRGRGLRLRPHVKTHNVAVIAKKQIKAGSSGVTVATLREAKAMAFSGIRDIFIARQIADEAELSGLAGLMSGADVSLAMDSADAAAMASIKMREKGLTLKVVIEIDSGAHRCGLESTEGILDLAEKIRGFDGLEFYGIFTHEGHVYSAKSRESMSEIVRDVIVKMTHIADALKQRGFPPSVVSIGSTPTLRYAEDFLGVNEVRPGNYVFNDAMQVANGTAGIEDCGLKAVATVISKPAEDRAVLNIGSKSLGSDRGANVSDPGGFGLVVDPERHATTRIYEEHSVIQEKNSLKIGQRVVMIPGHSCVAANLAPEIFVVSKGKITGSWKNTRYASGQAG